MGWLLGESFIVDHGRRSVIPERLTDALMQREQDVINAREFYEYVHFSDAVMTDQEILELPKVWVVGGDGGMGDIGYQNMSKVVLQNRPNIKAVMLDTQVYSNTGGQNSDSTPMLGGNDMNVFGTATQGKNVEKKTVAETFLAGHGSPFVAQVSIANAPRLYKAILDGIEYRGTAFLQCFTTCQPEHGVPDDMALTQAQRVRDSRGAPEFIFNPRLGETYQESLDLKGNPSMEMDWYETKFKGTNEPYRYTVAHWCATEARFRNHLKKVRKEDTATLIPLENMLVRITQQDVVYRRYLRPEHRSYVPDFGVYITIPGAKGDVEYRSLSRQLVLFCVERRKAWRMLQSKAGIENKEYKAQRSILAEVDAGKISKDDLFARGEELLKERVKGAVASKPGENTRLIQPQPNPRPSFRGSFPGPQIRNDNLSSPAPMPIGRLGLRIHLPVCTFMLSRDPATQPNPVSGCPTRLIPSGRGMVRASTGNQSLLAEYDSHLSTYEEFRKICETLLSQLLRLEGFRVHSVTSRLKTRKSFSGKLEREGKSYEHLSEVTDIVGLRVITHLEDEVDRIGSLIEREFSVDYERSIDKRKVLDPDRFGYLSLHYICGLNSARLELTEHRGCEGLACEIQVRSILQHAWAEIEHDLGYKAGALLPPHIRRRFSRLAGMLEMCDAEFSRLRDDIHTYGTKVTSDLDKPRSAVGIDPISLRAFIKKDSVLRALDSDLARLGHCKLRGNIETVSTAEELQHVGLITLDDLRTALSAHRSLVLHHWGELVKSDPHEQLPHGVSLWHLFQLMVAEKGNAAEIRRTFDRFTVGSPSERPAYSRHMVNMVRAFKRAQEKRAKARRSRIAKQPHR